MMQRFYCDRCGAETAEYWIISTTRVYYGRRDETLTQELCGVCYLDRAPRIETTDAPPYSTTSRIPKTQKRTDYLDDGPIRSESMGSNTPD